MASVSLRFLIPFLVIWQAAAIKFYLPAIRNPEPKCVSNPVHDGDLVIVSVIVDSVDPSLPLDSQRVDIEVMDSSPKRNVYLSKKNVQGEKRFAVTSHADGDVLVCFKNTLDWSIGEKQGATMKRIIDLDVDIGADAVDYKSGFLGLLLFAIY
jgi:p24 family protein delta-1